MNNDYVMQLKNTFYGAEVPKVGISISTGCTFCTEAGVKHHLLYVSSLLSSGWKTVKYLKL